MLHWRKHRTLGTPAISHSAVCSRSWNTKALAGLANCEAFSVENNVTVSAPVQRLLKPCRPATVSRLVIAVIVDAINGRSRWASTHVGDERFKVVAPTIANSNAAPAVDGEFLVSRIQAPLFNVQPDFVLRPFALAVGGERKPFSVIAAAARGVASAKPMHRKRSFVAAIAATVPSVVLPSFSIWSDGGQASKSLTGKVKTFRHRELPIIPLVVLRG